LVGLPQRDGDVLQRGEHLTGFPTGQGAGDHPLGRVDLRDAAGQLAGQSIQHAGHGGQDRDGFLRCHPLGRIGEVVAPESSVSPMPRISAITCRTWCRPVAMSVNQAAPVPAAICSVRASRVSILPWNGPFAEWQSYGTHNVLRRSQKSA